LIEQTSLAIAQQSIATKAISAALQRSLQVPPRLSSRYF
jgi:hypothetical protein